jgi:hypothetical protein
LRVRVDAGTGTGQAELPMGYPRQSLTTTTNNDLVRLGGGDGNGAIGNFLFILSYFFVLANDLLYI